MISLHRGNGRATDLDKIMHRIRNGGVPFTQGAVAWRSKRSPGDEPSCYTGRVVSFTLPSSKTVTSPEPHVLVPWQTTITRGNVFHPISSQRKEKDITLPVHVHHRMVKVGAYQLQNFSGRTNYIYINKNIL